ncbi:MAG: hypothetical protein I3273_07450, partial [Candidatus Moeniiplasma glomeromycotorum]|nr:hypothetical protein [Candidatus Moeniiplasma glomeromycotorum]MCE8169922.1 hypothetical protein [Candidatus Moeniiplasma glomeromycotorum]
KKIIFLSAYDKRKFPHGDPRKKQIFKETFGRFAGCELELIGFESEQQGASKADWIKKNASDFDLVIDDNPNICKKITEEIPQVVVCAPYYPSVKTKHTEKVLLVKTSVADLQKEDYQS